MSSDQRRRDCHRSQGLIRGKSWSRQGLGQYLGVLGVLAAIVIVTTIVNPVFLSGRNLENVLLNSSIILLVGLGMTFVILTGGIDLSAGSLAAFTGVFTADLLSRGMPTSIVIPVGLVLGIVVGIINGFIIDRFKTPPFVATLGMSTILRGAAIAYAGGYPVSIPMEAAFIHIGNGHLAGLPVPVIIDVIAFAACAIILKLTNIGRNIYAVGGNPEAARLSGINVRKTTLFAYATCSMLTAMGGMILAARLYTGLPSAANGLELQAVAGVVLGGTSFTGGDGSVEGTVIGVLLLGVLLNAMVLFGWNAAVQMIVQGAIIVVAVISDIMRKSRS